MSAAGITRGVLDARRTPSPPRASGCFPPRRQGLPLSGSGGEAALPCMTHSVAPTVRREASPQRCLFHQEQKSDPSFRCVEKVEKAFFFFAKYWTHIPSQLPPRPWGGAWAITRSVWRALQGHGGQAAQTRAEQQPPAADVQQARSRGR